MSIQGRIAIDVSFSDSTTSSGVQSLKKISLTDTTPYTSGKVAIVTGTLGTATVSINLAPTTYKNASGDAVSFSEVSRVAFLATRESFVRDLTPISVRSDNVLAVMQMQATSLEVDPSYTSGTASYTLVLYGT